MKVRIEMELADVLRISVLLDHHRAEAAQGADASDSASSPAKLWSAWSHEARELNAKLLAAVGVAKETR